MSAQATPSKKRFLALDYLRGYFILVIIIDHLSRWPSVFSAVTGKALLWVTAAEGFVIISGLLVGYVRGFKNRSLPFKTVAGKLVRRGLLLYMWSILGTIGYTALIWYVPLVGGAPGMPIPKGEWTELITQTLTLEYTHVWIYFLTLYAVFLVFSPVAIWLFRASKAWVVVALSLLFFMIGLWDDNKIMQWQALFFIPSVVGYYLDPLMSWWQSLSRRSRLVFQWSTVSLVALTITISALNTFYPALMPDTLLWLDSLFPKEPLTLWRILLAFVWFAGFVILFHFITPFIRRFLAWLLVPLGAASLRAYILHGLVISGISFYVGTEDESIWFGSALGALAVITVWLLLKSWLIKKTLPQ